jgi:hypothetical protein
MTTIDESVDAPWGLSSMMTVTGAALESLEHVPAGPWLAAAIDDIDLNTLSEWDLPAYLRACSRVKAWAAARESECIAELACRPEGFGADKEVALALREPVGASQRRVYYAKRLRRLLPETRRLFLRGDLTEKHVDAVVEATSGVDDAELLGAVEDKAVSSAAGRAGTARELHRATRRALTRLDPAGAQDRARKAREQADVTLVPGDDGMSTVVVDAPVEQALPVKSAADAYAATCKAGGDRRPMGVLRTEGLARICCDYLAGVSTTTPATPRAGGRPIEIGIVVGLETALGRRDLPAEVPGQGIVPREVVAEMIARELPRLRLIVIDERSGRLLHRAVDTYRPTAEQVAHVRAEYVYSVGPGSQVMANRTDTDHPIPHPDGPTQIGNLVPSDRTWHNGHTRQQLSVTVDDAGSVRWTSVLGQSRTVDPYDYRLDPEPAEDDPPPF